MRGCFVDDYDQAGDQYTVLQDFSSLDLTMKDGSVIKAGTNLTSQTTALKQMRYKC